MDLSRSNRCGGGTWNVCPTWEDSLSCSHFNYQWENKCSEEVITEDVWKYYTFDNDMLFDKCALLPEYYFTPPPHWAALWQPWPLSLVFICVPSYNTWLCVPNGYFLRDTECLWVNVLLLFCYLHITGDKRFHWLRTKNFLPWQTDTMTDTQHHHLQKVLLLQIGGNLIPGKLL